ncbi:TPA: hypothetical protein ACHJ2R_RS18570, partial [Escherichia coli]
DCLLTRVSASSNQFRNSNGYLPENS